MARGMQVLLSKEKAAKKHSKGAQEGKSNLANMASGKGMKAPCPICKQQLVDYFQLKQHYDTKHPKAECPPPPEA
eukprot:CAMPEP_0197598382 /NCGR_PEP_ID=MMETSP1326-20131121/29237_1 /TAXON_ID=1155430 /ORGANISM="Genus nov. species nov., Strain RCC2288" /LENGTH=74 /DNA_ID=CAMNT_0043165181 /DNA_START=70 /DNA_END=294 /DNA_ORIENTATION=+